MAVGPKELTIIPSAEHVDLPDRNDVILFENCSRSSKSILLDGLVPAQRADNIAKFVGPEVERN